MLNTRPGEGIHQTRTTPGKRGFWGQEWRFGQNSCLLEEGDGLGTILGWEAEFWGVMGLIRGPLALFSHRSCDSGRRGQAWVLAWECTRAWQPPLSQVGTGLSLLPFHFKRQPQGWVRQQGWATLCSDRAVTAAWPFPGHCPAPAPPRTRAARGDGTQGRVHARVSAQCKWDAGEGALQGQRTVGRVQVPPKAGTGAASGR